MIFDVNDGFFDGVIDDSGEEHGAENAAGVLVDLRKGHASGIDGLFEFWAEEVGLGFSLSRPAAEAFSVVWVPPQSEMTKPGSPLGA